MSVPIPKIVYDAGAGSVTFQPTYPPVNKPGPHDGNSDRLSGQRGDSISLSGKKQVAFWRTDTFRVLQMDFFALEQYANAPRLRVAPDATTVTFLQE